MKNWLPLSMIILVFYITSCNKDKMSDNDVVTGCWYEETELLDREGLCFDGKDTLYFHTRSSSRYTQLEKYLYKLNNDHAGLYLWPVDDPDQGRTKYKISLDLENKELSVWGLHHDAPDYVQKFKQYNLR